MDNSYQWYRTGIPFTSAVEPGTGTVGTITFGLVEPEPEPFLQPELYKIIFLISFILQFFRSFINKICAEKFSFNALIWSWNQNRNH